MGACFTNVQVHVAEHSPGAVRAVIVDALRQQAAETALAEDSALTNEDAGRVVYVAPAGGEPWITVYDSTTETQEPDPLSDLRRQLSQAGAAAVTVLVHDSDILDLHLYRDGAEVGHYNNDPDYFEPVTPAEHAAVSGQVSHWTDLLAPGATPEQLQAAWATDAVFVEDTLRRIGTLLGWNDDQCAVGYQYLIEDEAALVAFTRLAFR